ncbi:PLP-dependent aminotransferase family protein [Pseudomonas typographi]|uniref:aminotransferase-like domain-containing protein n=1 Tax=Pseudomonas typographi TaxID=2715964 RepID=UPI0016841BC8|nr:PLP-dependent aminotransferase family protein [Pseudomonas typographi]MBD1552297.1 PLP-dependent aminotransferase family protein [Pseudomonas typographi]
MAEPPRYRFTPAFEAPAGSAIRELFPYLSRPGMISFAGGYPPPALFDQPGLATAAQRALGTAPLDCLQYAATEGLPMLREQLQALMARRGCQVALEELMVTTGSQQGLDLLIKVLLSPGDRVLVERPTYPATLQALRLAGCPLAGVATDAEGLDTGALAVQLAAEPRGRFRLLYCVPSFANPTGACLPLQRRLALLALAAEHDFLIVEDDPYGALRFAGEPLPSLLALQSQVPGAQGRVIHLSSLSKVVAPGLRVGWMVAPLPVRQRCTIAKQTVDLCTSPWAQRIAAEYLAAGALEQHLPTLVAGYRAKAERMLAGLAGLAGQLEVAPPQGGMFVWGRCRHGVLASDLFQRAVARNVLFVPGTAFFGDNPDPASLRLSFAAPGLAQIDEGLERLNLAFQSA